MSIEVSLLESWDEDDVAELAAVMVDCVDGGASVNFLRPMAFPDAVAWWMAALIDPHSRTWVARGRPATDRAFRSAIARAAASSSSGPTDSSASAITSSATPRVRSSARNARADSPRPACRESTHIRANSRSSTRPTSSNRSSTRPATSSGTPRSRSAPAS